MGDALPMKWRSNHLQLGSRRVLKDNCLFSIMNGDSRTSVIARPFRVRDLAKKFFTFNDVKIYSFTVGRENSQDHIVLGNNHSQRKRLIMRHLDETAGLVCELAQLLEINHTLTSLAEIKDNDAGYICRFANLVVRQAWR
jgi:hypothetical protein